METKEGKEAQGRPKGEGGCDTRLRGGGGRVDGEMQSWSTQELSSLPYIRMTHKPF